VSDVDDIKKRLDDYSLRTNTNAMANALLDQRLTVTEKRMEEYHQRLHKAEDEFLVVKTIQSIHDTQIQGMRKILVGNGDRETIPMDLDRMERAIEEILKTNWKKIDVDLEGLKQWQEDVKRTNWLIWGTLATIILNRVWEIFIR
jgi:hypothetical protein